MQKDTGASVRIHNLAKGLATAGNEVKVILPKYRATCEFIDGVTVHGLSGLSPRAMLEVLRKLLNVTRPTSLYFYDPFFAYRIGHLITQADIVQIEQQASGVLLIPFIKRVLKKPVVIDCHDVFQALRIRHTSTLRRILETFLEKLAYKNADLLLVVSENERQHLSSAGFQINKIMVVPNGADIFFKNAFEGKEIQKKYGLEGCQIVVFVGNLAYLPNREAIQLISSVIAPRVLQEIENVKFVVVGKTQNEMHLPGIMFTGFVDDVADILRISDVAVAPLLHGSGTRLKILEYFSCGLPVVSTSVGADGLDVKNGYNIFIDDDLESFTLRIIELLKNKKMSIAMGKAARVLAETTYNWERITKELEKRLYSLVE